MFGLAVIGSIIIGLLLWIYFTRLAIRWGGVIAVKLKPEHPKAKRYGEWAGFMFLMGGWIFWWNIEFIMNLAVAKRMCDEAGIKVYITPEEWKEMIGGEEVWKNIPYKFSYTKYPEYLNWEGKEYELDSSSNERLFTFDHVEKKLYSRLYSYVYYDKELDKVLYKYSYHFYKYGQISGSEINISALKFWHSIIPSCSSKLAIDPDQIYLNIRN